MSTDLFRGVERSVDVEQSDVQVADLHLHDLSFRNVRGFGGSDELDSCRILRHALRASSSGMVESAIFSTRIGEPLCNALRSARISRPLSMPTAPTISPDLRNTDVCARLPSTFRLTIWSNAFRLPII